MHALFPGETADRDGALGIREAEFRAERSGIGAVPGSNALEVEAERNERDPICRHSERADLRQHTFGRRDDSGGGPQERAVERPECGALRGPDRRELDEAGLFVSRCQPSGAGLHRRSRCSERGAEQMSVHKVDLMTHDRPSEPQLRPGVSPSRRTESDRNNAFLVEVVVQRSARAERRDGYVNGASQAPHGIEQPRVANCRRQHMEDRRSCH